MTSVGPAGMSIAISVVEESMVFAIVTKLLPGPNILSTLVTDSVPYANAAIASSLAAKIYNLDIIKKNFQDVENNITRFLLMSNELNLPEIMEKNIRIFAFTDDFAEIAAAKKLGFTPEIDDAINGIIYIGFETDDRQIAIEMLQKCKAEEIYVNVIDVKANKDFTSEEYLEFLKGA